MCFSVKSLYSSAGFIRSRLSSIFFWISLNFSDVKSEYWTTSQRTCLLEIIVTNIKQKRWKIVRNYHRRKHSIYQAKMKVSWTDCWCSNNPGSNTVRKSFSNSAASHNNKTYSLWVKCSFLHAFWYLSLTSSSFRPPRPATIKFKMSVLKLFVYDL